MQFPSTARNSADVYAIRSIYDSLTTIMTMLTWSSCCCSRCIHNETKQTVIITVSQRLNLLCLPICQGYVDVVMTHVHLSSH